MMRREVIALAAAAGLCLAAGGGWLWAVHEARVELAQAANDIRAGLGPRGSLTYAASEVRPLARGVELSDVALRLPDGPLLTARRLSLSGASPGHVHVLRAEGLRFEAPLGGVATADALDVRDLVVPPPVPGQPYRPAPDAVFFSALELSDLAGQGSGGSARLADLVVGQYGPGRASTLRARDLAVPLPHNPAAELAGATSLSISGVALADLLGALARGDAPPRLPSARGEAEIDGLFLAHGAERPLEVARIVAGGGPAPGGQGTAGRGAVQGLVLSLPAGGGALGGLLPSPLHAEASWDGTYDPAGGVLRVTALRLAARELATLTISLDLLGLDAAALPPPGGAALLQAMLGVRLRAARLVCADAGLLEVLMRLGSRRTGLPPAQLRASIVSQVGSNPLIPALLGGEAARAAVQAFLSSGGTLDAQLAPPVPVTLGALMQATQRDPASLARQVGLQLAHTSP